MGRSKLSWIYQLVVTVFCVSSVVSRADGMCKVENPSSPLPTQTCFVPSCLTGSDCMPPAIDGASAKILFNDPLLQWKDNCPQGTGSCWQMYIDFTFMVAANDPSGMKEIGVNIATEVNAKRTFQKFWGKADQRDAQGRFNFMGALSILVPPGQRAEMSVFELCARDSLGNEGCVVPPKVN
jgi:hypothetical protein